MRLDERLEVARAAYASAIAVARAVPTPASWRRALAASRNLRTARRDHERAASPIRRSPPSRPGVPAPAPSVRAVAQLRTPPRLRWEALEAELERARALMEQSRRLVARSRALQASMAALLV